MLNNIPRIVYNLDGSIMHVINYTKVFFKNRNQEGYVLHVEQTDRVTSINEFELQKKDGKYYCTRKVFNDEIIEIIQ